MAVDRSGCCGSWPFIGSVGDYTTSVDRAVQRRLARRAVKAAFRYHVSSGFARFTSSDVKATAAHLCMPHVEPEIFQRLFDRLSANPDKQGVRIIRSYQTGHDMYAPVMQVGIEQKLAACIHAARHTKQAGLTRHQVARAVAGLNLATHDYESLQKLADPRRATFADDIDTLKRLAVAYDRAGRHVHFIGGRGSGGSSHSLMGFIDGARRTGYVRSLWLGFRHEGFFGEPLKVAGMIRRTKPTIRLKKNSLIVLSPGGLENAAAVDRVLIIAAKRNCKVVFAGPSAERYRDLSNQYATQHQARGMHL